MTAQAWTLAPNNWHAPVAADTTAITFDVERALVCVITPSGVSYGPQAIGGEVRHRRRGARPAMPAAPSSAERAAAPEKGATT